MAAGVYKIKTTAHEQGQQAAGWGLAAWHGLPDTKRSESSTWVCVHQGDTWPCLWSVEPGVQAGTWRIKTGGHKEGKQPSGWGLASGHGLKGAKRNDYSVWAAVVQDEAKVDGDEWCLDWTIVPGMKPNTWRILTTEHTAAAQPAEWGLSAWNAHGAKRNDWSSKVAVHSGDEWPMDWVFERVVEAVEEPKVVERKGKVLRSDSSMAREAVDTKAGHLMGIEKKSSSKVVMEAEVPNMWKNQASLPHLPLPSLAQSIKLMLASIRPLVSEEVFAATSQKASKLLENGEEGERAAELQAVLVERDEYSMATGGQYINWDDLWLRPRGPLYINPGGLVKNALFKKAGIAGQLEVGRGHLTLTQAVTPTFMSSHNPT